MILSYHMHIVLYVTYVMTNEGVSPVSCRDENDVKLRNRLGIESLSMICEDIYESL